LALALLLRSGDLPGIGPPQPVIGLLLLPAVPDGLPEDSVLVPEAVAHGRQLQGGHRVYEAGREPPEATVAEAGVGLLFEQGDPVESLFAWRVRQQRVVEQVHDVVRERAADQEL